MFMSIIRRDLSRSFLSMSYLFQFQVVLDQSGMYAATSCTDKTLAIYEYDTGELASTMFGHSELVTGLKFTNDCKHLVSVSGKITCTYILYTITINNFYH